MSPAFERFRALDRRAVLLSADVVARVLGADLRRPTPCAEWDLGALLAHMIAQHRGFAAAADGHGEDPAVWLPRPVGNQPVVEYAAAAELVVDGFARLTPDALLTLPELSPVRPFPAAQALSFHFVDYIVHAWDVAKALDPRPEAGLDVDDDLARAALEVALLVPDTAERRGPDKAFEPGLPVASGGSALDEVLARLGRSPRWPGPA
jgi:uncharacterized protein (TIGR03086 family)